MTSSIHFNSEVPTQSPIFRNGLWRVTVKGVVYCGRNEEELMHALGHHHSVALLSRTRTTPPIPVRPHDAIKSCASIQDKQTARARLEVLSAEGDLEAQTILLRVEANAARSAERANEVLKQVDLTGRKWLTGRILNNTADTLTRRLGKRDFSFVTQQEITENTTDWVMRHALVLLLMERFNFDVL